MCKLRSCFPTPNNEKGTEAQKGFSLDICPGEPVEVVCTEGTQPSAPELHLQLSTGTNLHTHNKLHKH